MRGTAGAIEGHVEAVAVLLERYGVDLRPHSHSDDIELYEDTAGRLSFELVGELPEAPSSPGSQVVVREAFEPVGGDLYERTRYGYELLDRGRDYRRAFHMHSPEWFRERYLVVVHEHCERPNRDVRCAHYEGSPLRDAFAGIVALIDAWTGDPPDRTTLRCLERWP